MTNKQKTIRTFKKKNGTIKINVAVKEYEGISTALTALQRLLVAVQQAGLLH